MTLLQLGSYRDIVEALREGFRAEIATPVRHHHDEASAVSTWCWLIRRPRRRTGRRSLRP